MIEKKFKLSGLGNSEKRSYFIIEKSTSIRGFLAYFLLKCGFIHNDYLLDDQSNAKIKDITKISDIQKNFKNDVFDIDIVYGYKNVILLIRYDEDNKKEFITKLVLEYCEMK